jgi:hypothetical protein
MMFNNQNEMDEAMKCAAEYESNCMDELEKQIETLKAKLDVAKGALITIANSEVMPGSVALKALAEIEGGK